MKSSNRGQSFRTYWNLHLNTLRKNYISENFKLKLQIKNSENPARNISSVQEKQTFGRKTMFPLRSTLH